MNHLLNAPDFLVIGAQKCGTSWLHERLGLHPEIGMPAGKDLEFFSYKGHLADSGFNRYLNHFEHLNASVTGEATASYFWTPGASPWCHQPAGFQTDIPRVVRQYLGSELKIIIGVRDPVERALSAYAHYLAHGELSSDTPFNEAMSYGGIIDIGFYGHHLRSWLDYFPLEQMIILDLNQDIGGRPAQTLQRLHQFLGVAEINNHGVDISDRVFPGLPRTRNVHQSVLISLPEQQGDIEIPAETIEWMQERYEGDKQLLRELVGEKLEANWLP